MKKRSTILLILLVVLIAMLLLFLILSRIFSGGDDPLTDMTIDTSPIILAEDDPANIVSLSYTYNGSKLDFEYSPIAYRWYLKDDINFPLEQTYLQYMAAAISSIAAGRVVEESTENFVTYGLDDPFLIIEATYKPEKAEAYTRIYNIGDLSEFNNNYYFNIEGDNIVYAIVSGLTQYFEYGLLEMAAGDTVPMLTASTVNVKKCTADDVDIDSELYDEIAENVSFISLSLVDYVRDEAGRAQYGFDSAARLVIDYTESVKVTNEDGSVASNVHVDHTFICEFGGVNADKMYVTVNDSGLVYEIDGVLGGTLTELMAN